MRSPAITRSSGSSIAISTGSVLGRAHALTGDRRYYDLFTSQLASWLAANPPLLGTNWASMLELGFRSLAWLWSLELFAGGAGDTDREPWLVDLLLGLDRQLTHVEHNLSRYFSPNTHLTGEALALYVGGLALPELRASARRTSVGRDVLVQEASRQIRADGGHAELSAHYHRYSTDFYLLAAIVARHAADPAAGIFEEAARRQARFLRTIADDGGIRPQIGDDDGGQCFPICGRDAADCRDTLATAAVLLDEPALAIGPVPEETYWMCGLAAADALPSPARWTSAALPASGYFVSRTARGDQLIVDAGPHGFLNGGHAHSDALSSVLTVAGRPLLIDPGTATYTMDYEVRDQFRGTMMHNTVVLDGQPQSRPRGAFHWTTATSARASIWRTSSDCDYIEGTHNGYAPRVHTRAVLALHGLGWWFFDFVLGSGTADIECYWHIDPSWHCTADSDHVVRLRSADRSLALASTAATQVIAPGAHPLASRSPAYGVIEPAPLLVGRLTAAALPTTIATFIPATPEVGRQLVMEESRIHTAPGPDWHGCAFRVRWSAGAMLVLAAVEAAGAASRDTSAPPHRWGTSEMQTDARVAALIDYSIGRSEAVLVNGALVSAHSTHRLVNLPRRVPLLRMSASALAPSMHEVGAGLEP